MNKPSMMNRFKSMNKLSQEAEDHYAIVKRAEIWGAEDLAERTARYEQYDATRAQLLEAEPVDHEALAMHNGDVRWAKKMDDLHQERSDESMDFWLENGRQHLRENPKLVKLALKLAKQDGVEIKR